MADTITAADAAAGAGRFKEAVCIDTGRIFDSCSDKDCLEDLQVYFTAEGQAVIDQSVLIRVKSAEVLDVILSVESVPFNKGFYAVDLTFYFLVNFSCYQSQNTTPILVRGLAYHSKKVILYGSEGSVKSFFSGPRASDVIPPSNLPIASVRTVDPITLGSRIVDCPPAYGEPLSVVPAEIIEFFGAPLLTPASGEKHVLVTIGLFTIVTLQRDVQLMIPAYDYVLPEKDCITSMTTDDPCEMFKRIKFPVNEFFPDDLCDVTSE
jgi:hypothetical protein